MQQHTVLHDVIKNINGSSSSELLISATLMEKESLPRAPLDPYGLSQDPRQPPRCCYLEVMARRVAITLWEP